MRKFVRGEEPKILSKNGITWGLDWEKRKLESSKAQFHWREVNKRPVNHIILPDLKKQTQGHCSFCDNYPICPPGLDTVEHFRPKSTFPREAYLWTNLYYCCNFCQQKSDDYEEALLRPDDETYSFDQFFSWDFTTGELKPKIGAQPEALGRADATIRLYRLNEKHPGMRLRERNKRAKDPTGPLDDFAYRQFVDDQSA